MNDQQVSDLASKLNDMIGGEEDLMEPIYQHVRNEIGIKLGAVIGDDIPEDSLEYKMYWNMVGSLISKVFIRAADRQWYLGK